MQHVMRICNQKQLKGSTSFTQAFVLDKCWKHGICVDRSKEVGGGQGVVGGSDAGRVSALTLRGGCPGAGFLRGKFSIGSNLPKQWPLQSALSHTGPPQTALPPRFANCLLQQYTEAYCCLHCCLHPLYLWVLDKVIADV